MFCVNLTDTLGTNIVTIESAVEAWGMIEILEVGLIISKDIVNNKPCVDFLINKLVESKKEIPLISVGTDNQSSSPLLTILPEEASPKLLAKTALAVIKREQNKINKKLQEDSDKDQDKLYSPVPINIFRHFASIPFDIFIRLKRGGEYQFLKRIIAEEGYDLTMIDGYEKKKVTSLYIEKQNFKKFTEITNQRFKELLDDVHTNSKSKEEIQEFVINQLTVNGFSESSLQLAQDSISKINKKIQSTESKLGLLTEIFNSQLGYRYRRSFMIGVIGSLMLKNLDWADSKHAEYITSAAYLHDMFLETDEEMDITSDAELEQAFLVDDHERVENHAKLASDKISKNDRIPAEVQSIVCQHHGTHSGIGFPASISPQVKKISIAFLVAEEFSIAILRSTRNKINVKGIIRQITERYSDSQVVVDCLRALKLALSGK
ncbi:MAG: hypothetical protein ACJAT2_002641 [Bacteriovoracaceae bacterium]|jgi:hypothetical protein